jgi:hypothetical protein
MRTRLPSCLAWNEELFRVLEGFPDLAHDAYTCISAATVRTSSVSRSVRTAVKASESPLDAANRHASRG